MPRDHTDSIAGFTIYSQSYYADPRRLLDENFEEEITVGFYHKDGGTSGEFQFIWKRFGDTSVFGSTFAIHLEAFSDGWSSLVRIPLLLNMMNDLDSDHSTPDISVEQFADKLRSIGIVDMTARSPP